MRIGSCRLVAHPAYLSRGHTSGNGAPAGEGRGRGGIPRTRGAIERLERGSPIITIVLPLRTIVILTAEVVGGNGFLQTSRTRSSVVTRDSSAKDSDNDDL